VRRDSFRAKVITFHVSRLLVWLRYTLLYQISLVDFKGVGAFVSFLYRLLGLEFSQLLKDIKIVAFAGCFRAELLG